ncbi:hypothetical protein C8F01DRAFT_1248563 [Mycena amicta]|nr:hypothetical protein C8F01DRAFT_1248563 [Mycena amicta]
MLRRIALAPRLQLGRTMATKSEFVPQGRPGIVLPVPHIRIHFKPSTTADPVMLAGMDNTTASPPPEFNPKEVAAAVETKEATVEAPKLTDMILMGVLVALLYLWPNSTPSKSRSFESLKKLVTVDLDAIRDNDTAVRAHLTNIIRAAIPGVTENRISQALDSIESSEVVETCAKIHQIVSEKGLDENKKVYVVGRLLSALLDSKRGPPNESTAEWAQGETQTTI